MKHILLVFVMSVCLLLPTSNTSAIQHDTKDVHIVGIKDPSYMKFHTTLKDNTMTVVIRFQSD